MECLELVRAKKEASSLVNLKLLMDRVDQLVLASLDLLRHQSVTNTFFYDFYLDLYLIDFIDATMSSGAHSPYVRGLREFNRNAFSTTNDVARTF